MKRKKPETQNERLSRLAEPFVRRYVGSQYNTVAEAVNRAYIAGYKRGQREHTGWA